MAEVGGQLWMPLSPVPCSHRVHCSTLPSKVSSQVLNVSKEENCTISDYMVQC